MQFLEQNLIDEDRLFNNDCLMVFIGGMINSYIKPKEKTHLVEAGEA